MKILTLTVLGSLLLIQNSASAQIATETTANKIKNDAMVDTSVHTAKPVKGENSFTEKQASRRFIKAGYRRISGLAKNDSGVWEGKATKHGKSVNIMLDYKGNVSSTIAN